jgi:hypothetical protein
MVILLIMGFNLEQVVKVIGLSMEDIEDISSKK